MQKQDCAECGSLLSPEDRYCAVCGAPVGATRSQTGKTRTSERHRTSASRRLYALPIALAVVAGLVFLLPVSLPELLAGRLALTPTLLPDVHDDEGIPYPEAPRISLAEAKARFDARTALFVDVRSQGEYDAAHILNAQLLSLAELPARYRELPRDREIITYCA